MNTRPRYDTEVKNIRMEFKITMTNTLRAVMEKVDDIQKQMGNISRVKETLRKHQKEMLQIKPNATEMENAFDELISRLDSSKKE